MAPESARRDPACCATASRSRLGVCRPLAMWQRRHALQQWQAQPDGARDGTRLLLPHHSREQRQKAQCGAEQWHSLLPCGGVRDAQGQWFGGPDTGVRALILHGFYRWFVSQ